MTASGRISKNESIQSSVLLWMLFFAMGLLLTDIFFFFNPPFLA